MEFNLTSDFEPTGDQPQAINQLTNGILSNEKFQTLLGVTGSGKTYTIANVINQVKKPTLVLSHNKTLAAQLYGEFKQFFPENGHWPDGIKTKKRWTNSPQPPVSDSRMPTHSNRIRVLKR